MPADLDRTRAAALMHEAGLDALVLLSPEAFRHATGTPPGVATMWRRAGAVGVLVPADPGLAEMAVASDLFAPAFRAASHIKDLRESPIWVEAMAVPGLDPDAPAAEALAPALARRGDGFARPQTFDPAICWGHLRDALAERGLASGRIGVEMAAISAADWPGLAAALAPATLADGTRVAGLLRAVKSPAEITLLRRAAGIACTGIEAIRDAVAPGVSRAALAAAWTGAIGRTGAGAGMSGAWDYISVGPDPWGGEAIARPGDIVKVDVGCLVEGYTSDTGRTFSVGPAPRAAREVHAALMAGFEAGLALLTPGTPFRAVHAAATAAIRARGFPGYARGHFGHSLGTGPGMEEWPFISAGSDVAVTPGMVLAFEAPWYITGLGGFIIEDQVEITEAGPVAMTPLPRALLSL